MSKNQKESNQYKQNDTDLDKGSINDPVNSDNAFSDKGLKNEELTNKATGK